MTRCHVAQLALVLKRLGRTTEGMNAAERARQLLEQSGNTPTLPAQDRTAKTAGAFSSVDPLAEPGRERSPSTPVTCTGERPATGTGPGPALCRTR